MSKYIGEFVRSMLNIIRTVNASWGKKKKVQRKKQDKPEKEWMYTCAKSRCVSGRGFEEDEGRVGRWRWEVGANLDLFSCWWKWLLQLKKRKERETFQKFSSERELVLLLRECRCSSFGGFGGRFWSWEHRGECHCRGRCHSPEQDGKRDFGVGHGELKAAQQVDFA